MSLDILENLTGTAWTADNELIKATNGKPSRVFPFIIRDFSLFGYFDTDLYFYTGKHYEHFKDFEIERLIRKFYLENNLADKYNISKAREIRAMIKYDPQITKTDFDQYDNLVNLNNGIYNYDDKTLIPHSHEYKFTYCLNVNYDPNQKECPIFTKFLQGCFATSGNWEDGYIYDKDVYENIVRLCGYLLYPRNRIEGLFIFLGEGSNGKSVLMDTLRLFFPSKYITNLSLNAISNEEGFTREKMINSWINFCSEQKGGLINSEELKKVASGEGLSIQRKHNTAIDIISRTKVVVNTNNMPYFNDTTYGILRRLFIFNFKNKFLKLQDFNKEKNPEKNNIFLQMDKDWLKEKIEKEKEAIFNLFLGGLERLRADHWAFKESQNMEDILNEYKEGSDVLAAWLHDHYEVGSSEDFIPTKVLYGRFKAWYEENFSKRCGYSSVSLSKKVREKFRLDKPARKWDNSTGVSTYCSGFNLIEKHTVEVFEKLQEITF